MQKFVLPALLALAAAGCATQAELTESQEYYVGRGVAANAIASKPLCDKKDLEEYVAQVGYTVALESDRPETFKGYHFGVLQDNDSINAFAAPSGFIFVTTGALIAMNNEDELAGVLAHEIAHVNLQHPELAALRAARQANLMEGLNTASKIAAFGLGLFGKEKAAANVEMLSKAFGPYIENFSKEIMVDGYGRESELAADALAVDLLSRPGVRYDPHALKAFIGRLPQKDRGAWATHPQLKGRIEAIDREIQKRKVKPGIEEVRTQRFKAMKLSLTGS